MTELCQDAITSRGGRLQFLVRQVDESETLRGQYYAPYLNGALEPDERPRLVVTTATGATTSPSTSSTTSTTLGGGINCVCQSCLCE